MAVVLALVTSAFWGTSDFFGGFATRREPVTRVMLWAHTIGLLAIAVVTPIMADSVTVRDLVVGAVAGLVGLVGLLLLYQGLSRGPMAVVAPLSALTAAVVPVAWGLRADEALSGVTTTGLVVGLAGVVAISWEGNMDPDGPSVSLRVIVEAVIAGICFGSIVLLYDATSDGSAPWPVLSGRVVTVVVLLGFLRARHQPVRLGSSMGFAAIAGLGDTFANVTLLLATTEAAGSAELSVVAVLAAFFPAATVLWARFLLHEPLGRVRIAGLALGLAAIALMTLG